jgi:two-component system LytT family response regulator
MKTICINTSNTDFMLNLQNIVRIQSSSNYCKIFFADKSYPLVVPKLLMWFENKLPAEQFVRTHRSHLINKEFIQSDLGNQLLLSTGELIGISRRRKSKLKEIPTYTALQKTRLIVELTFPSMLSA